MTNGYQQFFKKAKQVAKSEVPLSSVRKAKAPPRPVKKVLSPVEALREKIRARPKKSRPLPWKLILTSTIGVALTALGLYRMDDLERITKSVEISMMSAAMAEDAKAPAAAPATGKEVPTVTPSAAAAGATGAEAPHTFTQDEIDHFAKLNERKRELDARETELNRMESELAKQEGEMEKRLKSLESTRREIASVLEERMQADDKKVDSLVQVYSTMKPQQAAKIFETMDEDLAIEILGRMKKKPAAEILNLVKAEKAQVLSEKYAGYKRK